MQRTDVDVERSKTCRSCGDTKPRSEFYKQARARDGHNPYCKVCAKAKAKANAAANVERRQQSWSRFYDAQSVAERRGRALKRFKMTVADYDRLLEEQDGCCAICQQPETKTSPNGVAWALSVDHDHRCCPGGTSCGGCVRGLLCHSCNMALGKFRDDPENLLRAALYLENFKRMVA
jgi:hypothetical protein